MSVIKSFAHRAHEALSLLAPDTFRRGHTYELLAAGLGFKSWAALRATHVLVDNCGSPLPLDFDRNVLARALQLGLSQAEAEALPAGLRQLCEPIILGSISLAEVDAWLFAAPPKTEDDLDEDDLIFDDEEDDFGGEQNQGQEPWPKAQAMSRSSPMLLADLEERANGGCAFDHYRLAKLLTCKLPPDYLYQESLKGRVLEVQEQVWVDNYLHLVPQRQSYLKHLKAAADGGIRAANLDYAVETGDNTYRDRAVSMSGDVDWITLAEKSPNAKERSHWLREAMANGDRTALEALAEYGDMRSVAQLALQGDPYWLREAAESAIEHGDLVAAWTWHFVAKRHALDLTRSTLNAFHEGGLHDGEAYDSDFGGPLYVDGHEGLVLPTISKEQTLIAQAMAEQLLSGG